MRDRERVVITGLGIVAATGIGIEPFWKHLLNGTSPIRRITLCDVTGLDSQIAGEVPDFDPRRFVHPPGSARHMTRTTQLAVAAARLAVSDARLAKEDLRRDPPIRVVIGVSMGGFDFIEREIRRIAARGLTAMLPSVIGCVNVHPGATIIQQLGLTAELMTVSNSCVGGMDAIMDCAEALRSGTSTIGLAGAVDAPIVSCLMSGFCAARMLTTRNARPELASRPFDAMRDRGVLAEGAAIVVMETLSRARARGAKIYAEILGAGSASDGSEPPLAGLNVSMRRALAESGLLPSDIDFISAHGPSDQDIDRWEVGQIRDVFGADANRVAVSSIKGVTGNPLSAGGPMQIVAAALSFQTGWLPPIANYEYPDPDCDLPFVAGGPRRAEARRILVNAHGMGGVNAALVMAAPPAP